MEFDYKQLGKALAWNRARKNLRQIDMEILSEGVLRQPAVSAIEHGETRLAVDTLVEYCNILGIRADTVLDSFLTTVQEEDLSDAIVDPYVIQMAEIMKKCDPARKQALLEIAAILNKLP